MAVAVVGLTVGGVGLSVIAVLVTARQVALPQTLPRVLAWTTSVLVDSNS